MITQGINAHTLNFFAPQFGQQRQTAGGNNGATMQGVTTKGTGAEIKSKETPLTFGGNISFTPKIDSGKTSKIPGVSEQGLGLTFGAKPVQNNNSGLQSALSAIDYRDIALKGDRSGFEGQRFLNYLA